MNMPHPLISIIVPCYNVEAYLPRCIDSLLRQTYTNLEIILVDDGSPDRCGEICDEYARKDSRIQVIHKKNGGLSDARNAGIDQATGDYITFVDSDDWIHRQCVEILLHNLQQTNADISACSFVRTPQRMLMDAEINESSYTIYSAEKATELTLYQNKLDNSAWGKLYKKDLFDGLRFTVGRLYEDLDFFYKIYDRVVRLVHTDAVLYYYYYRADSIIGVFNRKRLDVLDITDEIVDYMAVHHPGIVPAAQDRKLSANFNILSLIALQPKADYKEVVERCWKNICALRWESLFNIRVRLKNKVGILVSLLGLRALMFCFKVALKK